MYFISLRRFMNDEKQKYISIIYFVSHIINMSYQYIRTGINTKGVAVKS